MADESLRLDVAVGLGGDATGEELDEEARLLRRELVEAGLGEVEPADIGPAPEGTRGAGGFLPGALTLNLVPDALRRLMLVVDDWAGRRPGRTLRLAYGEGAQRLELEYDPDKTDINQVMALLLARTEAGRPGGGVALSGEGARVGGDVVGGDKITEIHVAAGSTLIFNDAAATGGVLKTPDAPAAPPDADG